jgi:hypothetical protein
MHLSFKRYFVSKQHREIDVKQMGKRLAVLLIGAVTVVATIIGLAADFQDLVGGDDGADLVVEDFGANWSTNRQDIEAQVVVHNQGGEAAEDITVGLVVEVNGASVSADNQPVESIVADSSRTFNFTISKLTIGGDEINIREFASQTEFFVKAQVIHDNDTIESSTVQLTR